MWPASSGATSQICSQRLAPLGRAEVEIADRGVEVPVAHQLHRLEAVGGLVHLVPGALEQSGDGTAHHRLVVDHQDGGALHLGADHSSSSFRTRRAICSRTSGLS